MAWSDFQLLLDGVTADETTSVVVDVSNIKDWAIVITVSNATFTSGSVTVEGSDEQEYTGTWAVLATASEAAVVPADAFSSVLAQDTKLVIHGSNLALSYLRVRLNEAIVGGATVKVQYYGRS